MATLSEFRQRVQKNLGDAISRISSGFMSLSEELKRGHVHQDVLNQADKLFKAVIESHRTIAAEMNALLDQEEKQEHLSERLTAEKHRLEVLYASGILFSSETEMKALMGKAIDTVTSELRADAGCIVLTNEEGGIDSIFSRNMNLNERPDVKDVSVSVIRQTIARSKPINADDATFENEVGRGSSIIRLGLTAVLCVPLISRSRVFGAVYLDRRNKEAPFVEADLHFALSFARQIVRGMEISMEISTLENKIFSEATMRFEDLRKEFQCSEIVGSSKKLFEVLRIASKIAPTDASVILLGENGTGKDLLAHSIHVNSRRSSKPFGVINCGAIPADLLESELFGYESGAFTGATKSKPGKLELANGGTVFFDEIGEMNVNLQAKLLRVLQTKEIERLGGIETIKIDVRIIAATNRNIPGMISDGKFREDLYYRLKVIELTIPPLRERREDIAGLVEYFLEKHRQANKKYSIVPEALQMLEAYAWPGNVRELENVIQRGIVLAKSTVIQVGDLPPELVDEEKSFPFVHGGRSLLDAETEFRRLYILRVLRQTQSKAEAAALLGINRTHFYKLLAQLEIDAEGK